MSAIRMMRAARYGVLAAAAAATASGCNLVVDSSAYHVVAGTEDAATRADGAIVDGATGDGGSADGCTAATNRVTLENACTSADCVPFGGAVPSCEGGLCPLPDPAAADAAPHPDAASAPDSAAGDATTPPEAGPDASSGDATAASDATLDDGDIGSTDGSDETSAANDATTAADVTVADAATPADAAPSEGGGAGDASAVPSCATVRSDPNTIVFVTGSTALASFIGEVSKVLATQATNPITVVYQQSGSCVGVRSAIDPANNALADSLGAATYYDANGTSHSCSLGSGSLVTDIGASDVFYTTCYLGQPVVPALPQSVSENLGPVQVMNFAVPESSTQRSISLAAAYYIFGFGGAQYPIAPWTNPAQLQIRSAASGTQSMIGAAIGVPPAQWKGTSNPTSSSVGNALQAAGQSPDAGVVDSALGILASDYLLSNSPALRGLAVQDANSRCGFYPSTTSTAHDAANVRNGHYPLWGPSHFYARVDPQRQLPLKPGVSQFIDGLSGVTQLQGLDLVGEYARRGLIPLCAMSVARSDDGGDYTPFKPPVTCNCYFDLEATGTTSCSMCNTNADCPSTAPSCNKFGPVPQQGYCDR
jgi:hypothetical protein